MFTFGRCDEVAETIKALNEGKGEELHSIKLGYLFIHLAHCESCRSALNKEAIAYLEGDTIVQDD